MREVQDDFSLLDQMQNDTQNQGVLYSPGAYWKLSARFTTRRIKRFGLKEFRADKKVTPGPTFTDAIDFDPMHHIRANVLGDIVCYIAKSKFFRRVFFLDRYRAEIASQNSQSQSWRNLCINAHHSKWFSEVVDNYAVPDSMVGGCKDLINICGKEMSFAYFGVICRILNFQEHYDFSKIDSIMIIGGGFGYEAHLFLSLFPNIKTCINIDISPNLYIATQYLKAVLGDDNVVDYKTTSKQKPIEMSEEVGQKVYPITPWQIEDLDTKIDVLWNSCSFQEMSLDVIKNYKHFAEKLLVRSDNPKICVLMYTGEGPVLKKDILNIFSDHDVEEIEQRRKVYCESDGYAELYYLGSPKMKI